MAWVFVTSKVNAKKAKKYFEEKGQYNREQKVTKYSNEEVMIPIKQELAERLKTEQLEESETSVLVPFEGRIELIDVNMLNVTHHRVSPQEKLKFAIGCLVQMKGVTFDESLRGDIPLHWEQHGDLVLLPENSFSLEKWEVFGDKLWQVVAENLGASRLAKKSTISNDGFRTPQVSLLVGGNGWVTHIDNGIKYTFDVTKCMFSSGNITEKIRVGNFDCNGQTVVDLYAGIGYFVLPYLVHSKAAVVYACEWNKNAVEALRRNLKLNGVDKQCVIYEGDNQKFPLRGVADHVNLGLIPSSEAGWPVACAAVRSDKGGWLHVHGNVTSGLTDSERTVNGRVSTSRPLETCLLLSRSEEPNLTSLQSTSDDNNCGSNGQESHSSTCSHSKNVCESNQGHVIGDSTLLTKSYVVERPMTSSHSYAVSDECDLSSCNQNHVPSCNKKVKQEWLEWANYVAQTLLQQLRKSQDNQEWNVQVQHIEHVKSYAPHIDHVVLDVECRPLCDHRG